jgi:N-acyl-phosphatidylethanolamine-hydrolysing phospholipase D
MTASTSQKLFDVKVTRTERDAARPPTHHIVPPTSDWTSFFQATETRGPMKEKKPTGFRNPWPSWHKATAAEVWDQLSWGDEGPDPCVELAASHLKGKPAAEGPPPKDARPKFGDITNWPDSMGAKATRLLSIQKPDFSVPEPASGWKAKTTWLGHASVLLQLPSLVSAGRPLACLFDPIFSMRCSPSQMAGPIRSYPAPCEVRELPALDAVLISHNHYDHLDCDSVKAIWKANRQTVRFFVPLGNRRWFTDCGISDDRIAELDWWDSAHLSLPGQDRTLEITCTPAQHGSGRSGGDTGATLWASWYLEHPGISKNDRSYRVFFAGDTGYQFHDSRDWPPAPGQTSEEGHEAEDTKFPACPAFAEIKDRLGPPQLLLLPISVGATYAYLRSLISLPDSISPVPRHSAGLAGAAHMPAWDAVRVLRLMTEQEKGDGEAERPVAIAMHWGTFVTEGIEVLRTLGQLEWACEKQGVEFGRSIPGGDRLEGRDRPLFLAVNHGQSVCI